jgi:hypothetical protein
VDLEIFLDLGMSPVADAYTDHPDDPVTRYPLELAVCDKCRLVQLIEVLDDVTLFGTGYSFYSSASPPLSRYHQEYAADVLARYPNPELVVEVGCNDGDLLRWFPSDHSLGIDPAEGPASVATQRGLTVLVEPFTSQVANPLAATADLVIANHVLAHVADVNDFLTGLATLVTDDGIVMVEVQYLPDLLVNNAFDLVYHEHRNFFSLTSLEAAAEIAGLFVIDAELTSRQGGSLRVTLAKHPIPNTRVSMLRVSEQWLTGWGPYLGFQGRVDRIRERLRDLVWKATGMGNVVGYGAPAKATTLLNYCGINSDMLGWVVDSTPAKHGRFIPGTGLQIVHPDTGNEAADTFLILAWNYAAEIMRNNPGCHWLLPIPAPVML